VIQTGLLWFRTGSNGALHFSADRLAHYRFDEIWAWSRQGLG